MMVPAVAVVILATLSLFWSVSRRSHAVRAEQARATALAPIHVTRSQAVARVFKPLPVGFADDIMKDKKVHEWVRRVARPLWDFPKGVKIQRMGDMLEVGFKLSETVPETPNHLRLDFDRVRAALARVIAARAPEGAIELTHFAAGPDFEKVMDEDPPPERGK
jgi:hypothetical protein